MKKLSSLFGQFIGIHFAPDNHVVPVLRLERYHRVEGPGYFWLIPLFERVLSPVKTSLHEVEFIFSEVFSKDNIPFRIQLTLLFTFEPTLANEIAMPQLVRGGNQLFRDIVEDYASQSLRRLVSRFEAETLCAESTMNTIERDLTHVLTEKMKSSLGLAPLPNDGVIIKEAVPPEKFKQTMLEARLYETILKLLTLGLTHEHIKLFTDIIWAKDGKVILADGMPLFRRDNSQDKPE